MDGTQVLAVEFRQVVDGVADYVQQASLNLFACGDCDRTLEVVDTHSAA